MRTDEPTRLQIRFLGLPMATLGFQEGRGHALQFDPAFVRLGHDLSPLNMPLERYGKGLHVFATGDTPFPGALPGLIADSLPDSWGERMLRAEVPGIVTPMGKLAAIGLRGPGALTYEPVLGAGGDESATIENLGDLAREAEAMAASLPGAAPEPLTSGAVRAALTRSGGTLGGAFPKVSAHLPQMPPDGAIIERSELLVGGPPPSGYAPAIVKFTMTADAEGAVEYAYWRMAKKAGIRVPRACLVADGRHRHFACARFDRIQQADGTWRHCHIHTLSGMLHRNASDGGIDYEDFMRLTRTLCGAKEAVECFRRAVFNILAGNRDDHGRNHAFLYDPETRGWSLAPAYDMNPSIAKILIALSWLGSTEIPARISALYRLAAVGGIDPKDALEVFRQVEQAVIGGWPQHALAAGVPTAKAADWQRIIFPQTEALRSDAKRIGMPALPVRPGTGGGARGI